MLLVLDGWGHSESTEWNAIHAARTPVWDALWQNSPHSLIRCSGTDVGLPDLQMGNSEVGHMHIGAGRLIDQDLSRITKAIDDGSFRQNEALCAAIDHAAANGKHLHILGLLSPGGVHSHEDHIAALIEMANERGVKRTCLHAFLDGRDTPPQSAQPSLQRFERLCAANAKSRVASIVGRYFAMDRNNNWDRIELAYRLLVDGEAKHQAQSAVTAVEAAYARGETDEFVEPTTILDATGAGHRIESGDVVIFANFRADRARQITRALSDQVFEEFTRDEQPLLGGFVCMTDYGAQFNLPIAYPAIELEDTFGAVVADAGCSQLRIAETEKYAHVTFFFNGGEERVFDGEQRILIPSPDVATYDEKPEMSAPAVAEKLCEVIAEGAYDAIICNFANADMVGHTGNFDATVQCIEALDRCLEQVIASAREHDVDVLISADHGNAEKMRSGDTGDSEAPHTAHTSNLVPLVYVGRDAQMSDGGSLVDLAPTLLTLMGLTVPDAMSGRNLVQLSAAARDAAA